MGESGNGEWRETKANDDPIIREFVTFQFNGITANIMSLLVMFLSSLWFMHCVRLNAYVKGNKLIDSVV